METLETLEYMVEGPRMSVGERFVRIRRPKPVRQRTRGKSSRGTQSAPGGIRQRRNKHWNW